jgi:hypothetical protein
MADLLERLSSLLPTTKDKKVFLVNNYDQILSVFQERHVNNEEVQKFEELLLQQRELFAEESLRGAFPKLIAFVVQVCVVRSISNSLLLRTCLLIMPSYRFARQTEQALASMGNVPFASGHHPAVDAVQTEALVREFAASWRNGIQHINDDVLAYFANFRNGMEILKQVLTQLLLYYTRFQDIIKRGWTRPPPFVRDIVSTANILMEIKRYSRTF